MKFDAPLAQGLVGFGNEVFVPFTQDGTDIADTGIQFVPGIHLQIHRRQDGDCPHLVRQQITLGDIENLANDHGYRRKPAGSPCGRQSDGDDSTRLRGSDLAEYVPRGESARAEVVDDVIGQVRFERRCNFNVGRGLVADDNGDQRFDVDGFRFGFGLRLDDNRLGLRLRNDRGLRFYNGWKFGRSWRRHRFLRHEKRTTGQNEQGEQRR